jgi:enoyl-CoA hydratase/carnithine racemase
MEDDMDDQSTSNYSVITYDVDDPVALITLNRPEALNAWTSDIDCELKDAFNRAAADPRVVGIVVTGTGRAFSAGADMKSLRGVDPASPPTVSSETSVGDDDFAGSTPRTRWR